MKKTKSNILAGSCHSINRISSRVLLAFHPPKLAHAILGVPLKSYHPAMYRDLASSVTRLCITIFTFMIMALNIFININSVFAESFDTNVTIKPSLTLDISSNKISMSLDPASKSVDEQDLVVSVGTNNSYGYKLYISSGNTDTSGNTTTNLINIADSTKTIPNITSTYPLSSMPVNSWGYRLTNNSTISTGDYGVFTSGSIVSESDVPVNNNISTLGFASKIDYTMPSGTYELTLNFKALPIVTQYYMQDLGKDPELANKVCTEDPTIVIDKRDERPYTIAKLKDGNCWMTSDLNLAGGTKLYSETSDVPNGYSEADNDPYYTLPESSSTGFSDNTKAYVYNTDNVTMKQADCTSTQPCNSYYSWLAAVAGNQENKTTNGVDTSYSICPKGWRIPSATTNGVSRDNGGYTGGIFHKMAVKYGFVPDATYGYVSDTPYFCEQAGPDTLPNFLTAGYYVDSTFRGGGIAGQYWASSTVSAQGSYNMFFNPGAVYTSVQNARKTGYSVRCILR